MSGLQKKPRLFVSKWGVVRGAICKCTQNCRRRGASVGPRSSAAEVETKKNKKQKVRVKSECGIFYTSAPVDKHFEPATQTNK